MKVDMRDQKNVRDQVHAGLSALRVQARQIWGDDDGVRGADSRLLAIVVRLNVGVGDLSRLVRDTWTGLPGEEDHERWRRELKKELGNVVFSMIRWIDDLGFDVLECLDLAIAAQEKFAKSGRNR